MTSGKVPVFSKSLRYVNLKDLVWILHQEVSVLLIHVPQSPAVSHTRSFSVPVFWYCFIQNVLFIKIFAYCML